jgi:hypothetical protein
MNRKSCALLLTVVAGCMGTFADKSSAGLARLSGGSGLSGNLSRNKAIRHQQLICDPTEAPISGSSSVKYDPCVVSLSGLTFGPGYTGSGFVEEEKVCHHRTYTFLQNIKSFLVCPKGKETGYAQVFFTLNGNPGTMSPQNGFTTEASAGVAGVDTHSLMFTYLPGVPDTTVAKYTIFADAGGRPSGNKADSLTGIGPTGSRFTVGPGQISSATVSGSLAVPLPPAAWMGSAMLLAMASVTAVRKTRAAR